VQVFSGGPGAGKTSLARYAIRAASGFQVSAITGVESEISLEYGAVQQVLVPFLPLAGDLPGPQRQALGVAFGLEAGPAPDGLLVGLACLTLLSRAGAGQPVLCVVDDAAWIDEESARVLGFVARRLDADRVGVIVAVDDSASCPAFGQLPTIDVGGLPDDAARELLRSVVDTPLDPQTVDRVLAGTERNPLALVEVGSHFTAEEIAERAYRPEPLPVGRLLERYYLGQVQGLPADSRPEPDRLVAPEPAWAPPAGHRGLPGTGARRPHRCGPARLRCCSLPRRSDGIGVLGPARPCASSAHAPLRATVRATDISSGRELAG